MTAGSHPCSWCASLASSPESPAGRTGHGPLCHECFMAWQTADPAVAPCPACGLDVSPLRHLAHAASRPDPAHLALEVMTS